MPGNSEVIENAIEDLQKIVVESFYADPPTVRWYESSNITWRIRVPAGISRPRFTFNNQVINEADSLLVSPGRYAITATLRGVSTVLRELEVSIIQEVCRDIVVEEADDIRQAIQNEIDSMFPAGGEIVQRSPTVIDFGRRLGRRGISVQLKLVIPIKNGPIDYVNVDIDFRFAISVIQTNPSHPQGQAVIYLQGFDVRTDIDLPWYLDILWFGKIDESIERQLKPILKARLQRLLDDSLNTILSGLPGTSYLLKIYINNNGDLVARFCQI